MSVVIFSIFMPVLLFFNRAIHCNILCCFSRLWSAANQIGGRAVPEHDLEGVDIDNIASSVDDSPAVKPSHTVQGSSASALACMHTLLGSMSANETHVQMLRESLRRQNFIDSFDQNPHEVLVGLALMMPHLSAKRAWDDAMERPTIVSLESSDHPADDDSRPSRDAAPTNSFHRQLWNAYSNGNQRFHVLDNSTPLPEPLPSGIVAAISEEVGLFAVLVIDFRVRQAVIVDYGASATKQTRAQRLQQVRSLACFFSLALVLTLGGT